MEESLGILGASLGLWAGILLVLGILMPLFVLLSYGELKKINKNLVQLNDWMKYFDGKTKPKKNKKQMTPQQEEENKYSV